jgi:hypothetical protein
MHLAAAVPTRPGRPRHRACVVVAGGREPPHWEAYPHHQFLSTNGALPCCADGGCWKSRCQLVGDGDDKDRHNVCDFPVAIGPALRIPRCMHLITPEDVIRRIELYYQGGALRYADEPPGAAPPLQAVSGEAAKPVGAAEPPPPVKAEERAMNVLIKFRHGLGDAVQATSVLEHLRNCLPPPCQILTRWSVHAVYKIFRTVSRRGPRGNRPCARYDVLSSIRQGSNRVLADSLIFFHFTGAPRYHPLRAEMD